MLITNADLCRMFGVSKSMICEHLRADYRPKPNELDLRRVPSVVLGRTRYWDREAVEAEISKRLAPSGT